MFAETFLQSCNILVPLVYKPPRSWETFQHTPVGMLLEIPNHAIWHFRKTMQKMSTKKWKRRYGHLPLKIIPDINCIICYMWTWWYFYVNPVIQHHTICDIVLKELSLTFMKRINSTTGWLEIFQIPYFDLN